MQGRILIGMERAQSEKGLSALLYRDIVRDDLHNIVCRGDLIKFFGGDFHFANICNSSNFVNDNYAGRCNFARFL